MTYVELVRFCDMKYTTYVNDIHHYEDSNGNWVSSDFPLANPKSNFNYEEQVNEDKRSIKILDPIYLSQIQQELEQLLSLEERRSLDRR
jgi:hypothetical protein